MKPGDSVVLATSREGQKVAIYSEPTLITSDMKYVPYPEGHVSAGDVGIVLEVRQTHDAKFAKLLVGASVGWVAVENIEAC